MAQLKTLRVQAASDNNGRTVVIKSNSGTLKYAFCGMSGDSETGNYAGGSFVVSLFDNPSAASGSVIATFELQRGVNLPLQFDFQNGLTAFIRSLEPPQGAITFVFE